MWGNAETRVIGPSRFWVADRKVPEPNADAMRTAPAFEYLPHTFRDASWTPDEHERLQRAILQAVNVRSPTAELKLGGQGVGLHRLRAMSWNGYEGVLPCCSALALSGHLGIA